jgi:hypothetical protein
MSSSAGAALNVRPVSNRVVIAEIRLNITRNRGVLSKIEGMALQNSGVDHRTGVVKRSR